MNNLLFKTTDYLKDSRQSVLCIVTAVKGSTPGKAGAKMIVFDDRTFEGTVGGGAVEQQVISDAIAIIKEQTPQSREYNLEDDLSMTCGGNITVYFEPLKKPARLYIFGAGHIGKCLAGYTPDLGFETYLIDWREDIFEKSENTRYIRICKPYLEAAEEIRFDSSTYCVIVTPGHDSDEDVLAAVGKKPAAYIGLIGSRIKIDALVTRFLKENILTREELERVDMPIGIKFNAITPAEISISILAKLIDVRNRK
ncbi:MAG: XdhC family protein [Bacteroidales bacterium]|nr:XdhC family protein [Bacteroidales bacterium]